MTRTCCERFSTRCAIETAVGHHVRRASEAPEVDVDALREGQYPPWKIDAPQAQSAVNSDETKLIRRLVKRLRNNDLLEDSVWSLAAGA